MNAVIIYEEIDKCKLLEVQPQPRKNMDDLTRSENCEFRQKGNHIKYSRLFFSVVNKINPMNERRRKDGSVEVSRVKRDTNEVLVVLYNLYSK